MKEEKGSNLLNRLRKLREAKGGAFGTHTLKHGGSVKAIAATAAQQLHHLMEARSVDIITIQRKHLPELFGDNALQAPRASMAPTFKRIVREHLRARGIQVVYAKGLVDFNKISPKKNPSI